MAVEASIPIKIRATRTHKNFIGLKKRVESNSARAAYNFVRSVVRIARIRVPVRTGYLKSQIKWEKLHAGSYMVFVDGSTVTNTGAYYGVYVEYGTRHMAAQPFFRPAIEQAKREWKAEMKAVFK